MKKINLIVVLLFIALLWSKCGEAQKIVRANNKGILVDTGTTKDKTPPVLVGKYCDGKGIIHPVYKTDKGKLFYIATSKKTGKDRRVYLKLVK